MSNSMIINCVSGVPSAKSAEIDTQLVYNQRGADSIVSNIIYNIITHFINRFMQCGQNTVVSLMGSIQHCILCTVCTLAGFLANLQASNTCNKMLDAVKIKDVNDFEKECRTGRLDQRNVSFSNTPASMDTACQCTTTSMTTHNANTNNVWNGKLTSSLISELYYCHFIHATIFF